VAVSFIGGGNRSTPWTPPVGQWQTLSLFVIFLLAIVLSVLLRFTDSDYPFGIFKLLLSHNGASSTPQWPQFELTTYCTGKSNYHAITTALSMTMTRKSRIKSNKVNVLQTFIVMWLKFQNMLITGKSVCTFVDNIHISLVERFNGQHRICTILKHCFLVFCIIRWNTIHCHQRIPWSTSPCSAITTTLNMWRKFAFQLHILSKNNWWCHSFPYKFYNSVIKIYIYKNNNDGL
jgi:hypothetical protein